MDFSRFVPVPGTISTCVCTGTIHMWDPCWDRTSYNISEDIDIRILFDTFRGTFPEAPLYYELAPDAGRLTQVEAGFLAEMLIEAALDKSMNVIVDGTMRDSDYYSGYIGRLRKGLFAEYKVGIIYVHVSDLTIAKQRSRQREGQILRRVPQQLIEETYIQVCKAMEVLSHLVNISLTVQNDGDTPRILNIPSYLHCAMQSK